MDKFALITGATAGIGFELSDLMAAKGYSLALVARDKERLAERAATLQNQYKIKVITLVKDLSEPAAAKEIFQELANYPISILINNAGFGIFGPFAKTDLSKDLQMLQVNMTSLVELTKLFLKPMLERGEGRIMNVASTAAFQPGPSLGLYSASKAFVLSFSYALALEVEGTGVTVTTLCPGGTATEFQKRAGMEHTRVFSGPIFQPMSARSVAEIGCEAMMQGRRMVIAGWKNKIMIAFSRRAPISWAAGVARKLNTNR